MSKMLLVVAIAGGPLVGVSPSYSPVLGQPGISARDLLQACKSGQDHAPAKYLNWTT